MTEKYDVGITLLCNKWPPLDAVMREAAEKTLSHPGSLEENYTGIELSIALADDAFVQKLNKEYRGKNKPTNVLSFPQNQRDGDRLILGDVVLAYETILKESQEQNKSFEDHVLHMVIHGTLHLLGHDHENEREAKRMESIEISILKSFGVQNPYA